MNTAFRALAIAASLAGAAALAPGSALAAGGRGFAGPSHAGGGWHGGSGGGWHGGHGGYRGGYGRPVFWGGVGLGLGLGAVGYYGGWWGPYGDAPYYASYPSYAPYHTDGYTYDAVPMPVAPGAVTTDPAQRSARPVPQASRSPDPIFYPNKGQTAAATETDRRDCNRWATTQNGAMADASIFQRATYACMEGRGYTVR